VIPPAFINDLLARTDIVEIVRRHVELRRTGCQLVGLVPVPRREVAELHRGAEQAVLSLLRLRGARQRGPLPDGAFRDGLHRRRQGLAQQAGMTVPEKTARPRARAAAALKQRQATLSDVLAKAGEHFKQQLKASPRPIEYLQGRGLSGEIAARFGLGYAPTAGAAWRACSRVTTIRCWRRAAW
jgi:DNA primase